LREKITHNSAQARVFVFRTPSIERMFSTTNRAIKPIFSASILRIKSWSPNNRFASTTKGNSEAALKTSYSAPGSTLISTYPTDIVF